MTLVATSSDASFRRGRTAGWIFITGGAQLLKMLISIASAAILGRMLNPVDFGLMATAAPIIALATMIQNLGLNQALVQHPDLKTGHINALFYITMLVSGVVCALLLAAAPLIALFFHEPRLADIVRVLALVTLLSAASATPLGLLNRNLRFSKLAFAEVAAAALGLTAAAAYAAATGSYWALVLMQAVNIVLVLACATIWSGWAPGRATFDADVRKMLGFGAGFSTFNLLNFLSRNADNLLIARFNGASPLGLYDRAYKLMLAPLGQAIMPFARVLTPVLARLQDQPEAYRRHYAETTGILMAAVQPALLVTVIFSNDVIPVVLGERWIAAGPIFFWLALTGLHQVYTSTFGWLFISQGRGKDFAILGFAGAFLAISSFVVGLPGGPLGVAMAYSICDCVFRLPLNWYMTGRAGPVGYRDLAKNFAPHVAAMAACAALLFAAKQFVVTANAPWLAFFSIVSYSVNLAVLCAFRSKRVLLLEALTKGKERILRGLQASRTTRNSSDA
ncbi:MAG: lipopolysaccharide biosynthesis protein [Hyphomonadaceae bacterium]